jgi:hypothetical protein
MWRRGALAGCLASARGASVYATPVAHPLGVASWAPQEHSFFLINSGPSIPRVHVYFPQRKTQVLQGIARGRTRRREERGDEGPIYFY